jgi:hypothetical protein
MSEETWPKLAEGRQDQPEQLDIELLRGIWRGITSDEYGELAIVGTLAIALRLLQRADSQEAAMILAQEYWNARNKQRL